MIQVEEYLNNFFKGTKNPSLEAMKYFIDEYDNFQKEMKFIHIAGTNGKGSCSETISNILINQGYKVGKFISPHLIEYNERISINGENISNQELSDIIEELKPKIEKYKKIKNKEITLFELETTIGLLYFYRKNVDFVVLETGLGGLYDCTNIITNPLISIITSIGYDHMHILGSTLSEIAYQKAGIIKENSNTIFFEQSEKVNNIIIKTCKEKNNNLYLIKKKEIKNFKYDRDFQYFDYKSFKNIPVKLKGPKQINNAIICIKCIEILNKLGYKVTEENIRKGIKTVIHKGRMEKINLKPLIIFDGAHNEPAIQNLKQTIEMYYKNENKTYIISILKTKDYKKILQLLLEDEKGTFILTSGNDEEKYTSKKKLYEEAIKYKKEDTKIQIKTLEKAINEAKMKEDENHITFIVGSFYIYGDTIKIIKNKTQN